MAPIRRKLCLFGLAIALAVIIAGCGESKPGPSPTSEITPATIGRIAFVSQLEGDVDIYVMDADGSNQRKLTNSSAGSFDPTWSPDGSWIAFCSYRNGNNLSIYVMLTDGSNEIRLTTGPEDRKPAWSPDGSRIAYWSRVDKDWYICMMNTDGSEQTRLVKAGNENAFFTFVWSPK